MARQGDDDRDSLRTLRARSERQLERLADEEFDEVSSVELEQVAHRAATRATQLSRPEIEELGASPWHRRPAAKVGGAVALASALGAVIQALRQLGLLK